MILGPASSAHLRDLGRRGVFRPAGFPRRATTRFAGISSRSAGPSSMGIMRPWRRTGRIGWPRDSTRSSPSSAASPSRGRGWGSTCSTCSRPGIAGGSRGFLAGPGAAHAYMVHVGAGWALAQLRRPRRSGPGAARPLARLAGGRRLRVPSRLLPLARGRGAPAVPDRLSGYARAGLRPGAGPEPLVRRGGRGGADRRDDRRVRPRRGTADLWSGVGLACAYAGGVAGEADRGLERDGRVRIDPQLAQGVAFAAKARQRAGNPAPHTDLACRIVCGMSAEEAARPDGSTP